MMKGKILTWLGLSLLLVTAIIAGVAAFFADGDTARNKLVPGGVNTTLVEEFPPDPDPEPGSSFVKNVAVLNDGPCDCYCRLKVSFSNSDAERWCTLDFDTDNWLYSDGWWYLKDMLPAGNLSPSLFTEVTVSENAREDDLLDFDIFVILDSWQSDGFETCLDPWK